ncbi:hypothetical protein ASPTUDRAFT_630878 [Aspergillus tubingensis CBS 134.48]|uniref:Uncharacterized protein n=1 Tax=Aspergillus tubingensis (strain CBS 134.48) TaxID=767770 RepID=A0A1L9N3U1_ASPTC|nr:hypothetical protein ASPTUDRAFT_630878 [Aspergillus tubingensis CBS 134.48]
MRREKAMQERKRKERKRERERAGGRRESRMENKIKWVKKSNDRFGRYGRLEKKEGIWIPFDRHSGYPLFFLMEFTVLVFFTHFSHLPHLRSQRIIPFSIFFFSTACLIKANDLTLTQWATTFQTSLRPSQADGGKQKRGKWIMILNDWIELLLLLLLCGIALLGPNWPALRWSLEPKADRHEIRWPVFQSHFNVSFSSSDGRIFSAAWLSLLCCFFSFLFLYLFFTAIDNQSCEGTPCKIATASNVLTSNFQPAGNWGQTILFPLRHRLHLCSGAWIITEPETD